MKFTQFFLIAATLLLSVAAQAMPSEWFDCQVEGDGYKAQVSVSGMSDEKAPDQMYVSMAVTFESGGRRFFSGYVSSKMLGNEHQNFVLNEEPSHRSQASVSLITVEGLIGGTVTIDGRPGELYECRRPH